MLLFDIVLVFVIDVDVSPLNVRKSFKLTLQGLADIVSDLERQVLVHDDINFNVVFLPSVIRTTLYFSQKLATSFQ